MEKLFEKEETKEEHQAWLKSLTIKPMNWFNLGQESSEVRNVLTNEVAGSDSSTTVLRTHPDILKI